MLAASCSLLLVVAAIAVAVRGARALDDAAGVLGRLEPDRPRALADRLRSAAEELAATAGSLRHAEVPDAARDGPGGHDR